MYTIPPECHTFERDDKYLVLDPRNFIWFVTDENGKAAFEGLSAAGDPREAANRLAARLGVSPDLEPVKDYITKYVEHLLKIGFLHEGEYKQIDTGDPTSSHPQVLYLHLTNKCNLRCPYCYNQEHRTELIQIGKQEAREQLNHIPPSGKMVAPELSTEGTLAGFLQLVDEAAEIGISEVKLTGGEALLNRDALKIAAHAKERGMAVNLLTNGILIDDEMLPEIARVVDAVSISLDSDKAEEHDAVRGKGTHQKVVEVIGKLKAAGVKHIHVNAVITPVNIESVGSFLDYATNTLHADEVSTAGSAIDVEDPSGKWGAANYMLTREQHHDIYAQTRDFEKKQHPNPRPLPRSSMFRKHCGVGNGIISIDPNGDVYPCQTLHRDEFHCGNALKSGLKNILNESGVLKEMKRAVVDILPECSVCPVRYVCAGGCRSEAYTTEGEFLARNRTLCPTFFEQAVDKLWRAATIPMDQDPSKTRTIPAPSAACL